MKLASLCIPHAGGPYVFSANLRRSLAAEGFELRWIGVGQRDQEAVDDSRFLAERAFGEVAGVNARTTKDQASELVRHLCESNYELVIIHVLAGQLQANIARYLPPHILRVMVVHSITRGTYSCARAIRDYVHATVGASPRIRRDLVRRFAFPRERFFEIPYGIDTGRFCAGQRGRQPGNKELRVLSLGRIEEQSKGVFLIPDILRRLKGLNLKVTVAGDGPDLGELKRRLSSIECPIEFTGFVPDERVPELYRQNDVMLMPSHYEGFPLTVMEAMSAGCVPAVSRIRLVTDQMVEHGVTGWLFEPGNPEAAASAIRKAHSDRDALARMSEAAQGKAVSCYSAARMGRAYASLIRSLLQHRPPIKEPLDLADWEFPRGIRPGFSRVIPSSLKPLLRRWRERFLYQW